MIHSFVRVQTNAGMEQGYNTNARPLQLDENKNPRVHALPKLGDVPIVTEQGKLYREFLLDINQKANTPLLSLDELRLYVGDAPNLKGYDAGTHKLAGLDPAYDMDLGNDNWVKMNYRLNSGSGSGDVTVLIPVGNWVTNRIRGKIYLYSRFGDNHANNSGFEEWAVRAGPGSGRSRPRVNSGSLSGNVLPPRRSKRQHHRGDQAIANAEVMLSGVNDVDENVVLVVKTE